jgi:hypothetical protein
VFIKLHLTIRVWNSTREETKCSDNSMVYDQQRDTSVLLYRREIDKGIAKRILCKNFMFHFLLSNFRVIKNFQFTS